MRPSRTNHRSLVMFPQRPDHIPQEVWDLELPSIFGAAHPSFPDDEEPAADNEWISSSSSGVHQSDDECSAVSVHESQAGSSDAAAASPAILPQGDWGDIWNMDHIDHRYTLRLPSGIMPPLPDAGAPSIELLASVVCQRGWCNLSHLAYLSDNVPQQRSAKRRRSSTCSGTVEGNQRTFSVGAYSIGGCCGVQTNTRTFPWTTRWMCAMVGGVAPCHHFSSCTLLKDVMHFLHRDGGNDARSINLLMPCSRWQGGQIWIADEAGSVHLDATSGPGRLVNISPPFVTIRPRIPHATFPWGGGSRILLVAHHASGLHRLSTSEASTLTDAGFNLLQSRSGDV